MSPVTMLEQKIGYKSQWNANFFSLNFFETKSFSFAKSLQKENEKWIWILRKLR